MAVLRATPGLEADDSFDLHLGAAPAHGAQPFSAADRDSARLRRENERVGTTQGAQSLAEAARAVDAASRLKPLGPVVRFDQLDFYQLVLGARPVQDIATMARRVLAPLAEYDALRGGALVHTIRVFLECNETQKLPVSTQPPSQQPARPARTDLRLAGT